MNFKTLIDKLRPFEGVIRFILVLVVTHYFWKFTMAGDESDRVVTFLGVNLTPIFNWSTHFVAEASYRIVQWFTDYVVFYDNSICFTNGNSVRVVWGCNGLKQLFIFICIMLFSRGPISKKMWYIPIGVVILVIVNLIRVSALALIVQYNRDWFPFFHNYFFKYLFYAIIFLIWVFWEEKIISKYLAAKEEKRSIKEKEQVAEK